MDSDIATGQEEPAGHASAVMASENMASENLNGLCADDIGVGMTATYAKTVTETDIVLFAGISGDNNPVHLNAEFANGSPFGGRIAHGLLTASFISTVLGTRLPGPGAVYLSQSLRFLAPVRAGDTVTARVTVSGVDRHKRRAVFQTVCNVGARKVVDGEAVIMLPDRAA